MTQTPLIRSFAAWPLRVLALLLVLAPLARAQVVYDGDFAAPGPGWTNAKSERTPYGRDILGRYGNESARLNLTDLPPHTYVSLTVYASFIGPWAGNSATDGPNVWSLHADGKPLVNASFSNTSARQSYPQTHPNGDYPKQTRMQRANALGFPGGDSTYRFTLAFPHIESDLTLDFGASGLKNPATQSWALYSARVVLSQKAPHSTVVNGDFETPAVLSPWPYPAGSNVPGWTIASGTVLWVNSGTWQPASGEMSVDLSGGEPAAIRQSVPVGGAQQYNIRFALSGNPNVGEAVKRLEVLWNGNSLGTVEFDTAGRSAADMGWRWHQFTVTAPGGLAWLPLEFRSLSPGAGGPVLDAVSVTPVVPGDVDNNGMTDIRDVAAILRLVNGLDTGDALARYRADAEPWAGTGTRVHGDGAITMADALLALRMSGSGITDRENAVAAVSDLVRRFWVGSSSTGHAMNTWNGYYTSGSPSLWERAQFMSVIEDFYQSTGDPTLRARVTADWSYIRLRFPFNGLEAVGPGSVNGWSDDAGWAALMYLNTYRSTGITQALDAARGIFTNSMNRWLDDTYGGGLWYTDEHLQKAVYQASHILAGLRIWDATGETVYRDQSLSMYNWVESHLLRPDGLYYVEYNKNGPAKNNPPAPPREASSDTFLGGNMAMAVAHARLYRATGQMVYLDRALRTATAIMNVENDGAWLLMNDRDAWTEGFYMGEWVAEVLTLPGIDPEHAEMLRRTARAIYHRARTPDGYYGASWSGPSMGAESVWYATNRFMPTQINISSNSVHVIVAAAGIGLRNPSPARPFTP